MEGGKAAIKFEVDPKQSPPSRWARRTPTDEDMFHLQTLTAERLAEPVGQQDHARAAGLALTPKWWSLWLTWCRKFIISGRVLCADGSPVPGAEVHAYDVDYFWWWSSVVQVGPTADHRRLRPFYDQVPLVLRLVALVVVATAAVALEPLLVDRIHPVLKLNPAIKLPGARSGAFARLGRPNPQPLPSACAPLSARPCRDAQDRSYRDSRICATSCSACCRTSPNSSGCASGRGIPWTPWFDCTPDIIFRVTQSCGGGPAKFIVNESIFQTRWDIPTNLNVTLVGESGRVLRAARPTPIRRAIAS